MENYDIPFIFCRDSEMIFAKIHVSAKSQQISIALSYVEQKNSHIKFYSYFLICS